MPPPAVASASKVTSTSEIPWAHLLLALSTLVALLGLMASGWPSAIVWLAIRVYGERASHRESPQLLWASEAMCVFGFIAGQRISI
jgi:hypothetical protein